MNFPQVLGSIISGMIQTNYIHPHYKTGLYCVKKCFIQQEQGVQGGPISIRCNSLEIVRIENTERK